jgi:glycosyltransferase involved in cell wall biosynthesis
VVHRLLDSVLAQTWQNIEFIFVNDGSTDNTAEVLESYRERFAQRGIDFKVIYQENQGQAVALGNGLQYFTGEYLCWCDSDDYLESDAIACRLEALDANSQYAMVAGQTKFVDCESLECKSIHGPANDAIRPDHSFMSILQASKDAYYCCGAYMIRAEDFLKANPSKYIYPSRGGQNIQMLLPNFYHRGIYVLNKPVYNYVVYPNSHSHIKRNKEQMIAAMRKSIPFESRRSDTWIFLRMSARGTSIFRRTPCTRRG